MKNYNQYVGYFRLIFDKLLPLNATLKSGKIKNSEKLLFFAHFWVVIRLHTEKTIAERFEKEKPFAESFDALRQSVYDDFESYYCISGSEETKIVEELFGRYGIPFEF